MSNCSFTPCHLPGHFGFIGCHLWPFAHIILHFGCSLVQNLDGHIVQDLAALVLLPAFSGGQCTQVLGLRPGHLTRLLRFCVGAEQFFDSMTKETTC